MVVVSQAYDDMVAVIEYLKALQVAVTKLIFARAGRETPIGEASFDDELIPLQQFERPQRPPRPAIVAKCDLLPEGFDA